MGVIVEQKPLAKALAAFKGVIANRHIPILDCVRIEAGAGQLTLDGTDLDMWLRLTVPAEGTMPALAVPFARLERFVSALAGADVALSPASSTLTVKSARSRSVIPLLRVDDWPAGEVDDPATLKSLTLPLETLRGIVGFCADAADDAGGPRVQLTGICLDSQNGAAVASDGVGLSVYPLEFGEWRERPLVPASALRKVASLVSGEVEILVNDRIILFRAPGIQLRSKLVDAKFPDFWPRVIARETVHVLTMDRDALDAALARVMLGSGTHIIGFVLADAVLYMRAQDTLATSADCSDEVPCEVASGNGSLTFGMNGQYLRDALTAIGTLGTDEVRLSFNGDDQPVALLSASKSPAKLRAVYPLRPRVLPEIAEAKQAA